jgi:hypothetical protein
VSQKRSAKSGNLIRSCEAAKILGVSREYVRQMVVAKILPPKYLFNANSWRKIYIFDKNMIERFKDRKERKNIKWKEPEKSPWMTAIEVSKTLKCSADWIYHATKRGFLQPELVIASNKQLFRLYDKKKVEEAIIKSAEMRNTRRGHSPKTLLLMEKIKQLHDNGFNDSEIAIKTKSTQPFISKLRKELGLESNARRFHRRRSGKKGK